MTDDAFEALLERLGLLVTDRDLYRRALTHPSCTRGEGGADHERLEFLGDAVLVGIVASRLYKEFPDLPEGDLTRMKIALTSGSTLAGVARELDLGSAMLFGKGSEYHATLPSVLENAFEALVGAVFLDAGMDAVSAFVLRVLGDRINRDALLAAPVDAKNRLQELTQRDGLELPSYEIVSRMGPVHDPVFTAEVSFGGRLRGQGVGPTKQRAEQAAATAALEAFDDA
jgi:ribonuclease III